jgi:hypothetical protein
MTARLAAFARAAILLAPVAAAPTALAAQSARGSIAVRLQIASGPQLEAALAPAPLRLAPGPSSTPTVGASPKITVRTNGPYEIVVRRPAARGAAPAVWTRDGRGTLRLLAPGGAVAVAAGGAGEHRLDVPTHRAAADGPVALTYEVRLVGATQ